MKKAVKITIILVLAFAVLLTMCVLPSCKKDNKKTEEPLFSMAIITDLHVIDESQIDATASSASYIDKMASSQKMLTLSHALYKTEVDELCADKNISVVLVCGDMTEDGSKVAHQAVAEGLKKIEAAGKKVFVTTGNHDINKSAYNYLGDDKEGIDNITPDDFASIYSDFGFSEAIVRDTKTLSYLADLDSSRRILSIDACEYDYSKGDINRDHDAVGDELLAWVNAQLDKCKTDGKKVIAMLHFPVTSHMGAICEDFDMSAKVERSTELCEALIAGGVEYVFTGHLHTNDINTYTNADGKILYDVETGSLSNYSMPVRFYTEYKSTTTVTTKELDHVDEKHIPSCVSAEVKALVLADLTSYAESYVAESMYKKIVNKLDGLDITPLLGMVGMDTSLKSVQDVSLGFYEDVFNKFFHIKMYDKDAQAGEMTIESICRDSGTTLPASKYSGTVVQFAMGLLCCNYEGDENIQIDSLEYQILEKCVYSAVYILADFDIFGQLHAINEDIPDIDLLPLAKTLVKTGKLDLMSTPILSDIVGMINYTGNNSTISTLLGSIKTADTQAILTLLASPIVKNLVSSLTSMIPEAVVNLITGAMSYIDAEECTIDLHAIINEVVMARYAAGTLVDNGAPDHDIKVDNATGQLVAA